MVIVCGVDGSASSREAARAAAALAKLGEDRLILAYVQEAIVLGVDPVMGAAPAALASTAHLDADRARMKLELEREGERLAKAFQIEVEHVIRTGLPDQQLLDVVAEKDAALLVVASLGRRAGSRWRFGSVADRLAQSSPVPLLVVRDARPLERFSLESRTLSVVLALGSGKPTRAAVDAVAGLCKLGECELIEVHAYDPFEEARRLGLSESESPEVRNRIENALARDLPGRYGELGARSSRFVALPTRSQVAEALAEFTDAERADLLVVGTHGYGAVRRSLLGSVSFGLVAMVDTNVLVAPVVAPSAADAAGPKPVRVRRALVATDLSRTGNRAVELAASLLPAGGQLILLHVDVPLQLPSGWIMGYHAIAQPTAGERSMKRKLAEAELHKLGAACGEGIEVVAEVVEASDIPRAILEAATRHEPDLLCLGTHRHGRVASALIGSVARTVARQSERPVLLVPTEASA